MRGGGCEWGGGMLHVHYSQDGVDAAGRVDRKYAAGQRGVFPSQLQYDANHICGAGTKSSAVGVHSGRDSSRQYSAPGFCSRRWRGHEAAGLLLLRLTKWSLLLVLRLFVFVRLVPEG